jgi:cbb3-type cytochrome oxidase cytochrome c subunit
MNQKIKRALLIAGGSLLVIQFFQIDKTNPEVDSSRDFIAMEAPPQQVAEIMRAACYDCHSHQSEYPWYTRVQPVAWWIRGHIKEGREHLNFSTWGDYAADERSHKLEEFEEVVEEKEMPMSSYTWMHAEARLSPEQRQSLLAWIASR